MVKPRSWRAAGGRGRTGGTPGLSAGSLRAPLPQAGPSLPRAAGTSAAAPALSAGGARVTAPPKMADNLPTEFDVVVVGTGTGRAGHGGSAGPWRGPKLEGAAGGRPAEGWQRRLGRVGRVCEWLLRYLRGHLRGRLLDTGGDIPHLRRPGHSQPAVGLLLTLK